MWYVSKIHFNAGTHDTLYAVVQGWGTATGSYSILVEEELASIQAQTSKKYLLKYTLTP